MTDDTYRTITLTDRAPVRILESDWPVIASVADDTYSGSDYSRYQQASSQGELAEFGIKVRQHADGRILAYAWVKHNNAASWGNDVDYAPSGYLYQSGSDPVVAIRNAVAAAGMPSSLAARCIADLPAESI